MIDRKGVRKPGATHRNYGSESENHWEHLDKDSKKRPKASSYPGLINPLEFNAPDSGESPWGIVGTKTE